ncbi:cytochrome P450 [Xylariales sp. PMI_506]|nr:cytochrome P450 [Xylariales sp. PMI_506]
MSVQPIIEFQSMINDVAFNRKVQHACLSEMGRVLVSTSVPHGMYGYEIIVVQSFDGTSYLPGSFDWKTKIPAATGCGVLDLQNAFSGSSVTVTLWAHQFAIMYLTVFAVVVVLHTSRVLYTWRSFYLQARNIGLPCVIVPGLPMLPIPRILVLVLSTLLKLLPRTWAWKWTPRWLRYLDLMSGWHDGYEAHRELGSDSYVLVAPTGLMIVTCAPDAIDEVLHNREAFPRPVDLFGNIGRYGNNLACSEGANWKRMRRPISSAFGERNNREVWFEALYQASLMVGSWKPGQSIPLNRDTRRLSQNILSKAAFGFRMPWGEEDSPDHVENTKQASMSYVEASRGLVHYILAVIGLPEFILRYAPSSLLQLVNRYDVSFRAHILETIRRGRRESDFGGDDILHRLLRKAGTDYEMLSDKDILGNSFLLILGGHETVATSMQLAMIYLALNMPAQENVQNDVDRIVGQRPPEEWTYDGDLPQLLGSWVGAVMQEEMRLVSPVATVLTRAEGSQMATFDGVKRAIPAGTFVGLSQLGAHRNPKYWPHGSPANPNDPWHPRSNRKNDLEEFRPERWFVTSGMLPTSNREEQLPQQPGQKASLFRPQRGVYFPFSDGSRSCVGRRFAQIEYCAAVAVLFHRYSIELDVRDWISDDQLDRMTPSERHNIWHHAAVRVRSTIRDDMHLILTMHLKQNTSLPLRLVERGKERFR